MWVTADVIDSKQTHISFILNDLMVGVRLFIFALGCLALNGYSVYLPTSALLLAAFSFYAFFKAKKIWITYCHVAAACIWTASLLTFAVSGAPFYLLIFLLAMTILDGFYEVCRGLG